MAQGEFWLWLLRGAVVAAAALRIALPDREHEEGHGMAKRGERGPSARGQALEAIRHVIERLKAGEPVTPLSRRLMIATAEHAIEQIEAIQELKRPRRNGEATEPEEEA